MKIGQRSLGVFLSVLILAPVAGAQDHVVGRSALDQALRQRAGQEQVDREAIRTLLRRSEVREVASKAGLSLEKAEAAVSTLQGQELTQAASHARQVQDNLSGGASTIVISTTTIIIVLLVLLLVAVA